MKETRDEIKEQLENDFYTDEEINEIIKKFCETSWINSKKSLDILNMLKNNLSFWIIDGLNSKSKQFVSIEIATSVLQFYIFNQLVQNSNKIDGLEKKFDTLIKQNEELNNKFDKLIELLSKE